MQYELVSRALAYVSCFSAMSLLMTSVAIAAVNIGTVHRVSSCAPNPCVAGIAIAYPGQPEALTGRSQVETLALRLWAVKV